MAKSATLTFYLNGNIVPAPVEWADIEVLASFDNESIQANISIDSFTFVNDARLSVLEHINEGRLGGVGIFEGLPFRIEASNSDSTVSIFDGFLDLAGGLVDYPEQGRLECSIVKSDSLNNLEDRLSATTYAYLYEQGYITDSDFIDVPYVVVKPIEAQEVLSTTIALYLMQKAIAEQAEKIAKEAGTFAGILAAGVTGAVGAAIYAGLVLIAAIIYGLALLAAVVKMATAIVNAFLPLLRSHKAIKLKKLIQAAATYAGYELVTDIGLLENIVYLPSNINVDKPNSSGFVGAVGSIKKGIPNSSDFGYSVVELLQLARQLFNAKLAITAGNKLQFRSKNSPFWEQTSSYVLPDVLTDSLLYNTDEIAANRLLAFDTDLRDIWTIENFKGTNYEVITDSVTTFNQKAKQLKGLNEIRFQVCLGNRKNDLTALESLLAGFASVVDDVVDGLDGSSNLAAQVQNRINVLKVSDNNHSRSKLLYVNGSGLIPANHREFLSAKALYNQFWVEESFVSDNWNGQKVKYEQVRIPFGLDDYLQLIENSYISTIEGDRGKVEKISWRIGSDYATIDYWIRKPYTLNLKETFIEPE